MYKVISLLVSAHSFIDLHSAVRSFTFKLTFFSFFLIHLDFSFFVCVAGGGGVYVVCVCVCVCRGVSVLSLNHLHKLEVMSLYRYTIFDVYKCCIRFTI